MILDEKVDFYRGINVGSRRDLIQLYRFINVKEIPFKDLLDKAFAFVEAPAAFEYLATGGRLGKIVINVS